MAAPKVMKLKKIPRTADIDEKNAKAVLVTYVLRKWKKIIQTILAISLGKVKVRKEDGTYYTRKPDTKLLMWLVDTVLQEKIILPQGDGEAAQEIKELNKLVKKMVRELKNQKKKQTH